MPHLEIAIYEILEDLDLYQVLLKILSLHHCAWSTFGVDIAVTHLKNSQSAKLLQSLLFSENDNN